LTSQQSLVLFPLCFIRIRHLSPSEQAHLFTTGCDGLFLCLHDLILEWLPCVSVAVGWSILKPELYRCSLLLIATAFCRYESCCRRVILNVNLAIWDFILVISPSRQVGNGKCVTSSKESGQQILDLGNFGWKLHIVSGRIYGMISVWRDD